MIDRDQQIQIAEICNRMYHIQWAAQLFTNLTVKGWLTEKGTFSLIIHLSDEDGQTSKELYRIHEEENIFYNLRTRLRLIEQLKQAEQFVEGYKTAFLERKVNKTDEEN